MNKGIKLGEFYKDSVTGFEGVAICKVIFMNGCVQYGLTPKMTARQFDEGGVPKQDACYYVDEEQLLAVDEPSESKTAEPSYDHAGQSGGGFRAHP